MMILGTIIAACIGGALGYAMGNTKEMHEEANDIFKAAEYLIDIMDESIDAASKEFDGNKDAFELIEEIPEEERTEEQRAIFETRLKVQTKLLLRMIGWLVGGVTGYFLCVFACIILHITAFCFRILALPFDIILAIGKMIANKGNKKSTVESSDEEESEVTADAVDCEYCTEG